MFFSFRLRDFPSSSSSYSFFFPVVAGGTCLPHGFFFKSSVFLLLRPFLDASFFVCSPLVSSIASILGKVCIAYCRDVLFSFVFFHYFPSFCDGNRDTLPPLNQIVICIL